MLQWVIGLMVSVLSIIVTVLFFHSKNKNEKLEKDSDDLWQHVESLRQEKERIDKCVVALQKEVEMLKQQIDRQFSALDKTQKEMREFLLTQGEETKELIRTLSIKIDKYLDENQKLSLKVAEHIAKNGVKNG
jgi:peptidoglycan hydrolase CwlO-like protein